MKDKDARNDLVRLSAQIRALREVVARLLANESERTGDPKANFENYTTAIDARLYSMPSHDSAIPFQELVRQEVDWIVGAAQKIVSEAKDH